MFFGVPFSGLVFSKQHQTNQYTGIRTQVHVKANRAGSATDWAISLSQVLNIFNCVVKFSCTTTENKIQLCFARLPIFCGCFGFLKSLLHRLPKFWVINQDSIFSQGQFHLTPFRSVQFSFQKSCRSPF